MSRAGFSESEESKRSYRGRPVSDFFAVKKENWLRGKNLFCFLTRIIFSNFFQLHGRYTTKYMTVNSMFFIIQNYHTQDFAQYLIFQWSWSIIFLAISFMYFLQHLLNQRYILDMWEQTKLRIIFCCIPCLDWVPIVCFCKLYLIYKTALNG